MTQLPRLIEIAGLDGLAQPELVVIDAINFSSRYGKILQVISLTNTTSQVHLISEASLPENLVFGDPLGHQVQVLPSGQVFNWSNARSLLLYDRATGIASSVGQNLFNQTLDATLVDVLTWGPAGLTRTFQTNFDGPAWVDITNVGALARPLTASANNPSPNVLLQGKPDENGVISGSFGTYTLNPGKINLSWQPSSMPEPTTLGVAMGAVILLSLCRNRIGQSHSKHNRHL